MAFLGEVASGARLLDEIAGGGERALGKITAAVNAARRRAWAQVTARHGALPGVRVADKTLDGVWVTNRPAATKGWLGQNAYIDAAHRVHTRVEDAYCTHHSSHVNRNPK